jgi:hypothetical protein
MRIRTVRLRNEDLCLDRLIEVLAAAIDLPPRPADDLRDATTVVQGGLRKVSRGDPAPGAAPPRDPNPLNLSESLK